MKVEQGTLHPKGTGRYLNSGFWFYFRDCLLIQERSWSGNLNLVTVEEIGIVTNSNYENGDVLSVDYS